MKSPAGVILAQLNSSENKSKKLNNELMWRRVYHLLPLCPIVTAKETPPSTPITTLTPHPDNPPWDFPCRALLIRSSLNVTLVQRTQLWQSIVGARGGGAH